MFADRCTELALVTHVPTIDIDVHETMKPAIGRDELLTQCWVIIEKTSQDFADGAAGGRQFLGSPDLLSQHRRDAHGTHAGTDA